MVKTEQGNTIGNRLLKEFKKSNLTFIGVEIEGIIFNSLVDTRSDIRLNDIIMKVTFHVVREEDTMFPVLLENSILKYVDMVIAQSDVALKKKGWIESLKNIGKDGEFGKPNPNMD